MISYNNPLESCCNFNMTIKNAESPSDCFKSKRKLNVEAGHRFRRPHKEWRKRHGANMASDFLKATKFCQN